MKITERFSLRDDNTLQVETTITDPKALTQPYTTSGTYARHRDWTIAEYVCGEQSELRGLFRPGRHRSGQPRRRSAAGEIEE